MAAVQKITVYVTPNTRACNIRMRCTGGAYRLDLSGYSVDLTQQSIPPTTSEKAYVTSILNSVIAALS